MTEDQFTQKAMQIHLPEYPKGDPRALIHKMLLECQIALVIARDRLF